ncbi:MAG: murein biosynthesis integral membrane protein MurJ [Candidatus Kerfeldbacteria bacterium]|nr:murein biosynthesis integral membrane protein MurJ [Candidatus Kerfeldbacteria bacterium]
MALRSRILSLQRTIAGSALIIAVASIASRLLGLLRDRLLSSSFGAGSTLDAYYAAFKIPDIFFSLLILGALSGTFVPIFLEKKHKESEKQALEMTSTVINLLLIAVSVCVGIGVIFAPHIIQYFAYADSPEQQARIVYFVRVMSISLIFFTISTVGSFLLNAYKRFFIYSLAPIFYNLGIIIVTVCAVPIWGVDALPWGVVLGAFLHMCVQLPEVRRIGFRYHPMIRLRDASIRKFLLAMPGRSFSLGLEEIMDATIFALASFAQIGARTAWQFADNLQNFPINIFGASLSLAAFPVFAEAFTTKNQAQFTKTFVESVRRILFFIVPITFLTLIFRAQIVRLVYGTGSFNWEDTILTAQTLGIFSLSMFAQALTPLCTRAFFAEHKARIPIILSACTLVVSVVLASVLVKPFGVYGLAAAYSIASVLRLCLLFIVFRAGHELPDRELVWAVSRIVFAGIAMVIVAQGFKYTCAHIVDMQTWIGVCVQTVVSMLAGGAVYIAISSYFKFPEAHAAVSKLRQWMNLLR